MSHSDTIFAVSTGQSRAGIAVIRISGSAARQALSRLVRNVPEARRASLRSVRDPESGEILDKGMVLWIPGPGSATGEDMAELHLHGSEAVIAGVLGALGSVPGLRPAEAGEFTRRAFDNGRVDLVEVEGLADLLAARTARQRQQAMHQLSGQASSVFEQWREMLAGICARVAAAVDFVEEEGVAEVAVRGLRASTEHLISDMVKSLVVGERAAAIQAGVKVVLSGSPNVGKSSLLNLLSAREAAIVSARPGTTRDVIEVMMDIGGIPVILTDTAGLREAAEDEVEAVGISRARRELNRADIIIWVESPDVSGSAGWPGGIQPDLWVINKIDLVVADSRLTRNDSGSLTAAELQPIRISATTGTGIEALIDAIECVVQRKYQETESAVVVRARQRQAVHESIRYLNESLRHGTGTLELVAEDLRKAADAIGRLTGRIEVEELLASIFSEFCIGK